MGRIGGRRWVFVGVAVLLMSVGPSAASGQIAVGMNGSISDIRGGTFGVAGRVAVVALTADEWRFALEGVAQVFFPPCDNVDCDLVGVELNLLGERQLGGRFSAYLGAGVIYEDAKLQGDDLQVFDGDDWGLNLLVGNRLQANERIQPFLEVRLSLMQEQSNQFGFAAGIRVPLGGG